MSLSLRELCVALLQLIGALIVTVPLVTFLMASITWIHQTIRYTVTKVLQSSSPSSSLATATTTATTTTTAIYTGRVSHTRFQPVKHCFSYPLFFCLLDLSEVEKLFKGHLPLMWPLTYFINFRDDDHLKNGEGKLSPVPVSSPGKRDPFKRRSQLLGDCLSPRIRQLIKERTNGAFVPSEGERKIVCTTVLTIS